MQNETPSQMLDLADVYRKPAEQLTAQEWALVLKNLRDCTYLHNDWVERRFADRGVEVAEHYAAEAARMAAENERLREENARQTYFLDLYSDALGPGALSFDYEKYRYAYLRHMWPEKYENEIRRGAKAFQTPDEEKTNV